jgi:hypothetical protein
MKVSVFASTVILDVLGRGHSACEIRGSLSVNYESCAALSFDPVCLVEICWLFDAINCFRCKADEWQWKREVVGASETSILHGLASQKMMFARAYLIPGSNSVAEWPEELYASVRSLWHVAAECLKSVSLVCRTLHEFVIFQLICR